MRGPVAQTSLAMVLMALTLGAGVASAQGPIAQAVKRANIQAAVASGPSGGKKGALIGAAIGAGAAGTATYLSARTYGENEGGEFCTGCFVTWSAYAIPVGALVGAVVGGLVGHAASPQLAPRVPRTLVTPVVGRRGGAVVLTVRY